MKEYNFDGKIIFEGEYLNGKRNGMGKEYNNGELLFEGEYLNGKYWNGKIKGYNPMGYLEIKGEFLNGKSRIIWNNWKKMIITY